MLQCSDGSIYTGWTASLERRVSLHSKGKAAKYTRSRLPVQLVYAKWIGDRSKAMKIEARLKKMSRSMKLAVIKNDDVLGQTLAVILAKP